MKPRVTWLLPVRNGMLHLPATLASIASQTYTNWEILAWDNGSTDGTIEELQRWIPHRLPGRVVTNQPLPLGTSLAALVETASTELCARIDADDINRPERLERQVAFMGRHPATTIVGSAVELMGETGEVLSGAWHQPCRDAEVRWELRWHSTLNHPTVLFRRAAVLAAGNYRDVKPGQDYDLWLRLAAHGEMANLEEPLVRYRVSTTSVTAQRDGRHEEVNAAIAARNAELLFTGLDEEAALRLRRAALRSSPEPARFSDLHLLRRSATAMALAAGKPAKYFRVTRAYRLRQLIVLYKCLLRSFAR